MRFEVKLGDEIIGFAELEAGDPPMGVAGGRFLPTPAYSSIQRHCIQHRDSWVPIPGLAVSMPDGGPIECQSGVVILDYSAELDEIQIEVSGIPYPLYGELFPQHVQAYKDQFKKKSPPNS